MGNYFSKQTPLSETLEQPLKESSKESSKESLEHFLPEYDDVLDKKLINMLNKQDIIFFKMKNKTWEERRRHARLVKENCIEILDSVKQNYFISCCKEEVLENYKEICNCNSENEYKKLKIEQYNILESAMLIKNIKELNRTDLMERVETLSKSGF